MTRETSAMRIVCPHCTAAYEVTPELLAGRRILRCAKCHESWELPGQSNQITEPPAPVRRPEPPVDLEPTVIVGPAPWDCRSPDLARPAPRSLALRAGWAASIAVLAAVIGSAVAWRGDIMRAWPPSQRVYTALHLGP
jgi:predicted Zn finger-like uncharacterized protein